MNKNKSIMADSGLLLVAFLWGTTFVIVQEAISALPPFTFNAWRFLLAGAILFLLLPFIKKQHCIPMNNRSLLKGTWLGIILFLGYSTQTMSLALTTSAKVAFLTGLSVVLVPILGYFILRQIPKKTSLLGVFMSTIGLYLMTLFGQLSIDPGDLLAFFCSLFFGLHIIFTAKFAKDESSLHLTIMQLLTVSFLSFCGGVYRNGFANTLLPDALKDPIILSSLLFTAFLATSLAYLLQTYLQQFTPATHVGLIFIMEPVFAAFFAVIWQQATLTPHVILGSIFILVGMIFAEWPESKNKSRQQPKLCKQVK